MRFERGCGCVSGCVINLIFTWVVAMVFLRGGGLGETTQNAKISKMKGNGTYFTSLRGSESDLKEGVHLIRRVENLNL